MCRLCPIVVHSFKHTKAKGVESILEERKDIGKNQTKSRRIGQVSKNHRS